MSLLPSKPTTPNPHLLIIDHYQEWQAALYSVTGEAKSSTAQILSTARRLATFSLKLLAESKCLSIPDVDLNVDPPTKHLTRTLSAAETSLSELSHHMQDLMGNDPLDYGPLGMEMGYRKGTKKLADPKNLEHDQDTIEELIKCSHNDRLAHHHAGLVALLLLAIPPGRDIARYPDTLHWGVGCGRPDNRARQGIGKTCEPPTSRLAGYL